MNEVKEYIYTGIDNNCGFVKGKHYQIQIGFNPDIQCIEVKCNTPEAIAYYNSLSFIQSWRQP